MQYHLNWQRTSSGPLIQVTLPMETALDPEHVSTEHVSSEKINTERHTLVWEFDLNDAREIKLLTLIDSQRFVVVDDQCLIYDCDIATKTCQQITQSDDHLKGWHLDLEQQQLWLAIQPTADCFAEPPYLQALCLNSWQELVRYTLPRYGQSYGMVRRNDGCFLFYKHDYDSLEEGEHGFYCVDSKTGETNYHPLASKPVPDTTYRGRNLVIDGQRQLAVIPAADEINVDVSADPALSPRFATQIQLIDLTTFDIVWRKTVRWMTSAEIVCHQHHEQDLQAALLSLAKNPFSDDEDEDAWEELIDRLNTITFCDDEEAIWLCWSGGVLRKISLDGESMSPLYVMKEQDKPIGDLNETLAYSMFHTRMFDANSRCLSLAEHTMFNIDLTQTSQSAGGEFHWLDYQVAPKIDVVKPTPELTSVPRGHHCIEVDDLQSEQGLEQAMAQVHSLLQDIHQTRKGNVLAFVFKDKREQLVDEASVFALAVAHPPAAELLAASINTFNQYPQAWDLRSDEETPALAHAVHALASGDSQYLPIIADYFNCIDGEHMADFAMDNTLPIIWSRYKSTDKLRSFNRTVAYPFNGDDY